MTTALTRILRALTILAIWVMWVARAGAQPLSPCAVIVDLAGPSATKSISARATLKRGIVVVAQVPFKDLRAEFCDFDFGEHSIEIESSDAPCGIVIIRQIFNDWTQTQRITAGLPSCPGAAERIALGTGCSAAVRVKRANGVGIAGVTIAVGAWEPKTVSDWAGRALVLVPTKRKEMISATVNGRTVLQPVQCDNPWERLEITLTIR